MDYLKALNSTPWIGWIVGGFIGALIASFLRRFEAPKLEITPLPDNENTHSTDHKFLHVRITNKERTGIRRLIFGNEAALFCQARIQYRDPALSSDYLGRELDGRWASTGEPVLQVGNQRLFQYNKLPDIKFVHIMPGQSANLAVALKWRNEVEFYAFDNESYVFLPTGFKDPNKMIDQRACKVTVKLVTASGTQPEKTFLIGNPGRQLTAFLLSA